MKNLVLKDRVFFARFLGLAQHSLSSYSFANIYIWKSLFQINWQVIQDNLCVFFKDRSGCFLYLPPLGRKTAPAAISAAFAVMDRSNHNKVVSRIENVEEGDSVFYRGLGYLCREKFADYLYLRQDLVGLEGNKFKPQRYLYNYFIRHYKFTYRDFSLPDKDACLELYAGWRKNRRARHGDPIYQGMLDDSRRSLQVLLDNYAQLGVIGRVVEINGRLGGFTFGFTLNKNTFCILYEITDLAVKGLAQFIFCRLCQEMQDYKYINAMDDSGLTNLKQVKLSYRPFRLIPNYIVSRKYA